MSELVSTGTKRNWDRLRTSAEGRLMSRANKSLSVRAIVPEEYFTCRDNTQKVIQLVDRIHNLGLDNRTALASIGVNLLRSAGVHEKPHVQNALADYDFELADQLIEYPLPENETDLLGLVYQCLLAEGTKNQTGAYYTPHTAAVNMTRTMNFGSGQLFLDPCCGSGAFLLALSGARPEQIFGIDSDPIAVMIAKINLLLKYPDDVFTPQIYCGDYLKQEIISGSSSVIFDILFDYIATNPPWGAVADKFDLPEEITSGETFSYFFVQAFRQLKAGGIVRFLLPESVLKVKAHRDLRLFLLEQGCLVGITRYPGSFSGVTTKYVDIEFRNTAPEKQTHFHDLSSSLDGRVSQSVAISSFYTTENRVFNYLGRTDTEIIAQVRRLGKYRLDDSLWALGIVTGDNRHALRDDCPPQHERIYTGKNVRPYILTPASKYIRFDRSQLQQVARDEFYRAPEKLVYKFISNKLVFAFDDTQSLILNSANILIPQLPGMSIKTAMAFLNSDLFQYLHTQMFGQIKILKGNLLELPFPELTPDQDRRITELVDEIIAGCDERIQEVQNEVYKSFILTPEQIEHINHSLNKQ